MNSLYPDVAQRARHRCEYCHAPEVLFNFPFEVEHITPTSVGGGDALMNLALACRSCNLHKAARITGIDPLTQNVFPCSIPERIVGRFTFRPIPKRERSKESRRRVVQPSTSSR
jgi:hypothetical protein